VQDLAPAEQQTAPPIQKPSKERRIPKRIAQAVELLLTGECTTQKAAAERVNLSPHHLSKMLARDYVRVFCERRARQTIAAGQMRASRRLVELIDAGSEHVSLDATKHMLGIGGIAPAPTPSLNVNIELKAGYVIDLSERNPGKEQIVEHNQLDVCPPVGDTE
jgi:AraC-like DNA-binding protein